MKARNGPDPPSVVTNSGWTSLGRGGTGEEEVFDRVDDDDLLLILLSPFAVEGGINAGSLQRLRMSENASCLSANETDRKRSRERRELERRLVSVIEKPKSDQVAASLTSFSRERLLFDACRKREAKPRCRRLPRASPRTLLSPREVYTARPRAPTSRTKRPWRHTTRAISTGAFF